MVSKGRFAGRIRELVTGHAGTGDRADAAGARGAARRVPRRTFRTRPFVIFLGFLSLRRIVGVNSADQLPVR
jgi:hypothetical protein